MNFNTDNAPDNLNLIRDMQNFFQENLAVDPYPMYPNYGIITQYQDIPISVPE